MRNPRLPSTGSGDVSEWLHKNVWLLELGLSNLWNVHGEATTLLVGQKDDVQDAAYDGYPDPIKQQ